MNREATDWEENFIKYISVKEIVPIMYEEFLNSVMKSPMIALKKWAKNFNRHFSRAWPQTPQKSASLTIVSHKEDAD